VHLDALRRCPGLRLVALAEPDPARLAAAARREPAAWAGADYRELLGRPDVEAVLVCVPSGLHAEVAEAAFGAGKHVYLEKPLAIDRDGASRVLAAWRASGRVGMIGFNSRFDPLISAAAAQLREGRLGELAAVRCSLGTAAHDLPDWKRERAQGGGVLLDLASHHLDLLPFLLGDPVRSVFAQLRSLRSEADTATLQLRFASGLVGQCLFSLGSIEEDRLEVLGRNGKLVVDRLGFDVELVEPTPRRSRLAWLARAARSLVRSPNLVPRLRAPLREPSYDRAMACFASACRGQAASPDLLDGLRSLEIVLAAEESASSGRPVDVRPIP
jgi:predicted dehydrogenase